MTTPQEVKEKAAQLLEAAGLVIRLPGWWTQEYFAKDEQGALVEEASQSASCFCALGAIWGQEGGRDEKAEAVGALNRVVNQRGSGHVPHFNDAPGRTAEEVSDALLQAAHNLRTEAA